MNEPESMRPTERAEAQLARIGRLDRVLNAFALVVPELARETAWIVEREGKAGPLAGRTLAVKDLLDMRGLPTGGGARTPVVEEASADSAAVARLKKAGMIPLGKAAMVELAFGTWGINCAMGTPRNPWDSQVLRVPGGSSSGSAVAVAAGLACMALGSDTGGSIRIPSALNGLTGLRPSFGRVSRAGCLPLSPSMDTVGPMAWSVAEVVCMMQALAGPDPADPATASAAPLDTAAVFAGTPLRGQRLAVLPDSALASVATEIGDAYLKAVAELERLGARLVELPPAIPPQACIEPAGMLLAGEAWGCWAERVERYGGEMDPGVRSRLGLGAGVGRDGLVRLHAGRAADQGRFYAWLQDYSALLTPTVPITAPAVDSVDESNLPFSTYTRMANWLDLPALALPCGVDRQGLPMSLQILGLPGRDEAVLALGHAYQQATDWHMRRPDMTGFTAG